MVRPNGLAFSSTKAGYSVVDTGRTHGPENPAHMRVFDVDAKGKVSGGNVFADCTAVCSMASALILMAEYGAAPTMESIVMNPTAP